MNSPIKVSLINDSNQDVIFSNERIAEDRFKMFFSGLIFAILSFIVSHPTKIDSNILKSIEIASLLLLFAAGSIILAQLSRFGFTKEMAEKIEKWPIKPISLLNFISIHVLARRWVYWCAFLLGMLMLIIDRSLVMLLA